MLTLIPILNVVLFICLMVIILWAVFGDTIPTREETDELNSELREVRRDIRDLKYGGNNIRNFGLPTRVDNLEQKLESITLQLSKLEGIIENRDKLKKLQELYTEEQRHEQAKKLIKQDWE